MATRALVGRASPVLYLKANDKLTLIGVDTLLDILTDSLLDVAKTLPLLLAVYALLYYIEHRLANTPALLSGAMRFGPIAGALAGTVPQCGFSAVAAALYAAGYLAPATLVSVFLSTSDEAIPVLLAGGAGIAQAAKLLLVKFTLATLSGYALQFTFFRLHRLKAAVPPEIPKAAEDDCSCGCGKNHSPIAAVLTKTARTALFLFVVLTALNLFIGLVGKARVASLLLAGSLFQPLLCAILGLVPSCAMSVLLSELFVSGTISFGALVAGLSTGAGFGYIVLFSEESGRRRALPVIAATLLFAIAGGTVVQIFLG